MGIGVVSNAPNFHLNLFITATYQSLLFSDSPMSSEGGGLTCYVRDSTALSKKQSRIFTLKKFFETPKTYF